jgi:hypothetical protein
LSLTFLSLKRMRGICEQCTSAEPQTAGIRDLRTWRGCREQNPALQDSWHLSPTGVTQFTTATPI